MERLTRWNGKKYILPQGAWREITDRLTDYENAEENGTLLRLPCKIGDTVFRKTYPNVFIEHIVSEISFKKGCEEPIFTISNIEETGSKSFLLSDFGKEIFTVEQYNKLDGTEVEL